MSRGSRSVGEEHADDAITDAESRAERLTYLADMVAELRTIAAREGCVTLAGLLDLAQVEAQNQARGAKSPV